MKRLIVRTPPGAEKIAAKYANRTWFAISPSPFSLHPVGSKEFRIRVTADRHHYRHGADNRYDTSAYRAQNTQARPGPSVSRETAPIAHLSIRPLREIHSPKTTGRDTEAVVERLPTQTKRANRQNRQENAYEYGRPSHADSSRWTGDKETHSARCMALKSVAIAFGAARLDVTHHRHDLMFHVKHVKSRPRKNSH